MMMLESARNAVERFLFLRGIPSPWSLDGRATVILVLLGSSLLFFLLYAAGILGPKKAPSQRGLLRLAKKAQNRGRFAEAGTFFMAAKHYQEAARAFVQAEDFRRAAETCLAMGDFANAAQCLVRAGDQEKGAEYFLRAKDFLSAADCYLSVGLPQEAARLYLQGGQGKKAAECFVRMGLWHKAGSILAAAGEHVEAAQHLLRALQERSGRRGPALKAEEDAVTRNLARTAAEELVRSGQMRKAAQVLETAGFMRQAAGIYEEVGERRKASDLYLAAGDTSSAARIFEASDRPQEVGTGVAEMMEKEGRLREAADLYLKMEEWSRAGSLFLRLDQQDRALEAYRRAGESRTVADLLLKMGRRSEAADTLVHAGRMEEAARIYHSLGDTQKEVEALLSGRCFLEAGARLMELAREQEATEALQRVETSHPRYGEAARLLGDIFFKLKHWSLSIANYQRALGDDPVRREDLEAHYRLALALKEDGQLPGAVAVLEKILLADYHYRDVQALLAGLRESLRASAAGGQPLLMQGGGDATIVQVRPSPRRSPRYRIMEEVGRGGMGVVYKVHDATLDRIVAYKVLPAQVQKNPKAIELFLREAKAAARLSHPNIVTIFDAAEEDGEYFIVMEFVEGKSLKEILDQQKKLPLKAAVLIAIQLFRGLAYAHGKGIVHRDIKPPNLLWAQKERMVKITDFGLARAIEEGRGTFTQMTGTPFYMAPEQIVGGEVDHRVDLYGSGATLYELLTGTVPFREGDVLYHHVHTAPRPPRELEPAVPNALSDLILRCLEKKPQDRYPDVEAVLADLKRFVH